MKGAYVYILSNKRNGTLYTGVTSNLVKRIFEHKEKVVSGFSAKYNLDLLVYYEERWSIEEAIQREKQLKAGNRKKKTKFNRKYKSWLERFIRILRIE